MDILYRNSYGFFTITYTIVGIVIGVINFSYIKENKMSLVYLTVISTIIFETIEYIWYLLITGIYSNIFYFIKQIVLASFLNIIIVYVLYGSIKKIVEFFGGSDNNTEYL